MDPLHNLKVEVCWANKQLLEAGLVTSTSGNVSGIDRASGKVIIKPSGIDYTKLQPDDLSVVDLATGSLIEGKKPSVDLSHHLFLYQKDSTLGGIVHTHSNYATAFAAVNLPIPCCLTAMADEFGAEIPCLPYVDNEGDHIAEAILKYRGRGPAVLLGNHGVFTFDKTATKALKAAIMTEDVAKTIYFAKQLGQPQALPPHEIEKWWNRYHTTYGQ
ncbi:MAG: class II aldolase/adducin family protein [Verrucomicrobiota bacterium]|nr:class II aldolase/adducin family protein [Verrucomicrobiota bacterium]